MVCFKQLLNSRQAWLPFLVVKNQSLNCQWIHYRHISIHDLSTHGRQVIDRWPTVCQLLFECQPTLSPKCKKNCWLTVCNLSANFWPTVSFGDCSSLLLRAKDKQVKFNQPATSVCLPKWHVGPKGCFLCTWNKTVKWFHQISKH